MQAFDSIRELSSEKRYITTTTKTMSENNSSEGCLAMNSHEINEKEGPEICTLYKKNLLNKSRASSHHSRYS